MQMDYRFFPSDRLLTDEELDKIKPISIRDLPYLDYSVHGNLLIIHVFQDDLIGLIEDEECITVSIPRKRKRKRSLV
jgi:hypothetical protein